MIVPTKTIKLEKRFRGKSTNITDTLNVIFSWHFLIILWQIFSLKKNFRSKIYVCVCVYIMDVQMPTAGRRRHRSPWIWSTRGCETSDMGAMN